MSGSSAIPPTPRSSRALQPGCIGAALALLAGHAPAHTVPHLFVRQGAEVSSLYAGGVEMRSWHAVWKPVCGSDTTTMTADDLACIAAAHEALMEYPAVQVDTPHLAGGFNLVFNVSGSIPAGALTAIATAEQYMESVFSDPITVTIDLSFAVLASNVLGGTSSSYGYTSWSSSRAGLVAGMDANDTIQAWLPSGSTIPVRYTNATTNEDRVFWTKANYKATVGTATGSDASMQFNSVFTWDFDPSNGITGGTYSFVDVLIHETGHAMGFTSGIDFRSKDIEALDVFRFQTTDGSGDLNPDTLAEFQARPRLARWNQPNDAHHSDLISAEFAMSDGSPYQASHFREQTANIGIMDPAFAAGQTFYPAYYSPADVAMFDAIGWDN